MDAGGDVTDLVINEALNGGPDQALTEIILDQDNSAIVQFLNSIPERVTLLGQVSLGGLTAQGAEERLTAMYEKDYLRNPQVSVFIKEFTSQRITVEGAVGNPGIFPIKGQTSLLQAIAAEEAGASGEARLRYSAGSDDRTSA